MVHAWWQFYNGEVRGEGGKKRRITTTTSSRVVKERRESVLPLSPAHTLSTQQSAQSSTAEAGAEFPSPCLVGSHTRPRLHVALLPGQKPRASPPAPCQALLPFFCLRAKSWNFRNNPGISSWNFIILFYLF